MQQSETGTIPPASKLTAELLGIGASGATLVVFILILGDEIINFDSLLLLYVVVMILLTPSYVVIGHLLHRLTDGISFLKWNMCILGCTIVLLLLGYLFMIMLVGTLIGQ